MELDTNDNFTLNIISDASHRKSKKVRSNPQNVSICSIQSQLKKDSKIDKLKQHAFQFENRKNLSDKDTQNSKKVVSQSGSPLKKDNENRKKLNKHLSNFENDKKHFPKRKKNEGKVISSIFNSNPEPIPICVKKQESVSEPLFTEKVFSDLQLHPYLVSCLKSRLDIEKVTTVQEQSIPVLLSGKDALIKSSTGSGKTLAYAIPIVQHLQQKIPKISRNDGVFALIIVPARELALQCFDTFSTLTKPFTWVVPGYLMGGEKKKSEKARLRKGINILISTPGRLLDHLDTTSCFSLDKIEWLVIDEADRLLEEGFENAISKLISKCKSERQSVLLSATLSTRVEHLAGLSLTNPSYIDIANESGSASNEFQSFSIPSNLKQYVTIVPAKLRLVTLSGFIVENCLKGGFKGVIFMSSQTVVDYHHALLSDVLCTMLSKEGHKCKTFKLHGKMEQEDRRAVFLAFRKEKNGILFCTDVAARGLDLHVDWIVQYSVPESIEIYVHRVGRTARIGRKGNSLLFLLPSESRVSNLLNDNRINFEELEVEKYLIPLQLLSNQLQKREYRECASALHFKYEDAVYSEKELYGMAKEVVSTRPHSSSSDTWRSEKTFHEHAHSGYLLECKGNLQNKCLHFVSG